MADGVYMVEPAKPWHKTRLSAEEWFAQNPPHRWRSLQDAMNHYTASGFEVLSADSSSVLFTAPSRYTTRRFLFWALLLGIPSVGTLLPLVFWWHIAKSVGEETPGIMVRQDYENGTGLYIEVRTAGHRTVYYPGVLE